MHLHRVWSTAAFSNFFWPSTEHGVWCTCYPWDPLPQAIGLLVTIPFVGCQAPGALGASGTLAASETSQAGLRPVISMAITIFPSRCHLSGSTNGRYRDRMECPLRCHLPFVDTFVGCQEYRFPSRYRVGAFHYKQDCFSFGIN